MIKASHCPWPDLLCGEYCYYFRLFKCSIDLPFSFLSVDPGFWIYSCKTGKQTTFKVTFPTLGLSLNGWYRTPSVSCFLAIKHTPMYRNLRGSFGVISRAWPRRKFLCSTEVGLPTTAAANAEQLDYSRPWGASIERRQKPLSSPQKQRNNNGHRLWIW